jgi:hypothetical protein
MSKTLTQSEYDKGVERFKQACVARFNLAYQWPRPAAERLAAVDKEYDEAFAAISDGLNGVNVVPDPVKTSK